MNLINVDRGEKVDTNEVMRQFDLLEDKIEQLIEQNKSLTKDNFELKQKKSDLEAVLEEKTEAENNFSQQKTLIRSKIDHMLERLNQASEQSGNE